MKLSIVIVSYNTKDKLKMTLESVFKSQTDYEFEVCVVDNASIDGSLEMVRNDFPKAELIENKKNLGYAKANNQGIRQAKGKYVLLLNSDVEVETDSFDTMTQFMDNNKDVGIAGCKVVKPDGSLDKAARRSFPDPKTALFRLSGLSLLFSGTRMDQYNLTYLPEGETQEVDSVMGAFFLIRREVVDEIGLLDEDFFMYGEDIDFCFRAKERGWKVYYVPDTTVVHHKGSSSRKASKKALYEFHRAMWVFYNKHYRERYSRFMTWLIYIGIWLRYYTKALQNLFRKEKIVSK